MKITKFNSAVCKDVDARVEAALKVLADELGVVIKPSGGNYTAADYVLKLKISTVAEDGSVNMREAEDFKMLAWTYGLKVEDLGREFICQGKTFKIVGAKARATKQPILCSSGGQLFKFSPDIVKKFLKEA